MLTEQDNMNVRLTGHSLNSITNSTKIFPKKNNKQTKIVTGKWRKSFGGLTPLWP